MRAASDVGLIDRVWQFLAVADVAEEAGVLEQHPEVRGELPAPLQIYQMLGGPGGRGQVQQEPCPELIQALPELLLVAAVLLYECLRQLRAQLPILRIIASSSGSRGSLSSDSHMVTLGKTPEKFDGRKAGDAIKVPKPVKTEILKKLHGRLPAEISSPRDWGNGIRRYSTVMALTQGALQDNEDGNLNIVQQGVKLAKDLIDNGEDHKKCWETLADVWTDLIIDIAPSWNAEAHKHNMESGGEFITLLWALLWHCGIEKNSLSHEDNALGSDSGSAQEGGTGAGNTENNGE
ncbi:hypothetical protein PR202_ga25067 [Eleusine coracana subsp. coracana]|uniref:DUF4220 domain-containing protein n=1 Tax=Eleusine coracana subsp. coracana TaxID=191504 RepID=A0AAV5DAF5_ELECO|nr:hypothetical protein PR202_ga25067 [Eleusine coracana subsp. coracana]